MSEPSIHDIINKNFSTVGRGEWMQAARDEIPENISFENLFWNVDGLTFSPYYIEADLKETQYLKSFHASSNRLLSPTWLNMPEVSVIAEGEADKKSSLLLQRGADGIVYDLTNFQGADVNTFINSVSWEHLNISFKTPDTKVVTDIFACAEKKINPAKLRGSIWWNRIPKTEHSIQITRAFLEKYKCYHLFGIDIPFSTPIKELSTALAQTVMLVDEMTDHKIDRNAIFRSISLCFTCSENILVNMAKLKSMRMLWYQLSQAFEIPGYLPTDLLIRCRTGQHVSEKFQPHGNMIRNTFQAVSAIAGGANEVTIIDEGAVDSMTDRVALNVANILKEESHLGKVADPLAGSYVIEKMVHEFSQAAWIDFQNSDHEA